MEWNTIARLDFLLTIENKPVQFDVERMIFSLQDLSKLSAILERQHRIKTVRIFLYFTLIGRNCISSIFSIDYFRLHSDLQEYYGLETIE